MEPKSSLLCLQVPPTCPYPKPTRWSCFPIPLLEDHINIILPSTPGSSKLFLSRRFPHQNPVCISPLAPTHATCPAHLILLDLITRIIFGEQYRSLISSLCSFLHSHFTSSLLGPNILLVILHSDNPSLHSSLIVSDQDSHWISPS